MNTQTIYLNHSWKFHYGEEPDAWKKDYDDTDWTAVELPHDWSVTMPFSRSYSSGTGYASGGIGWYRGTFSLPEKYRGKRIVLLFDGVYKESQVWFNSYYHGFHPNGYTPFFYDITSQAVFGTDGINEISVRVDRTEISDSRWFTGSGITRKVTLLVTDLLHVTPYGICFSINRADKISADLSITTEICNREDQEAAFSLIQYLRDQNGNTVFFAEQKATLLPGGTARLKTEGTVTQPTLWSPKHPSLYTLETWLHKTNADSAFLADKCRVGIRTFRFDADYGFFLNEIPMKIKGVCVHHDAGALGAAVTKEIWIRRLEKLKGMGCNAIRMSHNPHMPELYDLCDEMGFLVMDEAFDEWEGPKNKWSTGHNVYPPKHQGYYKYFPQYQKEDLSAMVLRDRNHPSVILWSIGNEIDYPNDPYCHPLFQTMTGNNDANKPAAERVYNPDRPNAERLKALASMLACEVRAVDTTRPVTLAAAFPELSAKIGFLDALDVAGYNYKEHLYEESHRDFPSLPFLGSENGHDLAAWHAVTENEYISGQFLWTGIDYMGEAHGWPLRASKAGLLTMAGFEKSGFYRRMSFWSSKPMCHLSTQRTDSRRESWQPLFESWNYCEGEDIEVRCYTNLSEAELFLNGISLGKKEASYTEDSIRWIVPFQPGTLMVLASGTLATQKGGASCTFEAKDELKTTSMPCALQIRPWKPSKENSAVLPENPLLQFEVYAADRDGAFCFGDSSMVQVTADGGVLLGIENGNAADCTEYASSCRRLYHGRLIFYVRRSFADQPVTVQVSSELLKSDSVTIF